MRVTQHLQNLRRAFRWHRRFFAALFAAVAVLAALSVLASRGDAGTSAVVATRTIAGGAVVTEADLAVVRVPASVLPEGAFADASAVVGQTVVADVPSRRVLSASDLLGGSGQVADGRLALPVRFDESSALALLRVGTRIDILGANSAESGFGVIAEGVRVVAIPQSDGGGLLGAGQAELVLVEVTPEQAGAISAAAAVSSLNFALR
ncbi:MAG TPA: SAF domain-containing protein [Propionicimonas sp.]|nr:SAF domain-containing protein [Propionicimonas sp.]HRA07501.1 SAF domain-containing protein [Propionicimonas sp.]